MITSRFVLECIQTLNELGRRNDKNLIWAGSHWGVEANQRVDYLANREVRGTSLCAEPL